MELFTEDFYGTNVVTRMTYENQFESEELNLDAAFDGNKYCLIELSRFFAIEEIEDHLWFCDIIMSEFWCPDVHETYFCKYWNGNVDNFKSTITECIEYFSNIKCK